MANTESTSSVRVVGAGRRSWAGLSGAFGAMLVATVALGACRGKSQKKADPAGQGGELVASDVARAGQPASDPAAACAGHVSDMELPRAARYRIDVGQPVNAVAVSPDGLWMATGDERGQICLRAADTGSAAHRLDAHDGPVTAVGFVLSGKVLVSAGGDGVLRSWDTVTGKLLRLSVPAPVYENDQAAAGKRRGALPPGHTPGAIVAMDTAPGDALVVTGGIDGRVRLWDARSGAYVRDVAVLPAAIADVAFSPAGQGSGGRRIAVAAQGMTEVHIYDVASGELVTRATGAVQPVVALAFAPGGELLAIDGMAGSGLVSFAPGANGAYGPARLGDLGFDHAGHVLAVSPASTPAGTLDDPMVLIGASDHSGRILVGQRGAARPVAELRGHSNAVRALAVAPHGRSAVSGGRDGRVFAWDLGALPRASAGRKTGSEGAAARQQSSLVAAYRDLEQAGCDPVRAGIGTPMEARILRHVPRALAGDHIDSVELRALFAKDGWLRGGGNGDDGSGGGPIAADPRCMERLEQHERALREHAELDPRVERVLTTSIEVFTGLRRIAQPDLKLGKGRQRAGDDQVYWVAPCSTGCKHVSIMCEIDPSSRAPSCEVDKR